jgi:hypothetical protein
MDGNRLSTLPFDSPEDHVIAMVVGVRPCVILICEIIAESVDNPATTERNTLNICQNSSR